MTSIPRHGAVVMLMICVIALGACIAPTVEPRGYTLEVTNDTATPVSVKMVGPGRLFDLGAPVQPGETQVVFSVREPIPETSLIVGEDGCLLGPVIALAPNGSEVARHEGILCLDARWIVETTETGTHRDSPGVVTRDIDYGAGSSGRSSITLAGYQPAPERATWTK